MTSQTSEAAAAAAGGRKRAQLKQTEKNVFVWLSVSSVIISACIVAVQFLAREAWFNQKVINEKAATEKRLGQNISNAKVLQQNIDNLMVDSNLSSVSQQIPAEPGKETPSNLRAIFDALPVDGDATAFANSLQATVFPRSGVGVIELNTSTEEGSAETASAPADASTPLELPFKAGFSGSYANIEKALADLNRVIRPIKITELTIRTADDKQLIVNIGGSTYYSPSKTIEVKTESRKQ